MSFHKKETEKIELVTRPDVLKGEVRETGRTHDPGDVPHASSRVGALNQATTPRIRYGE